jgi:glutaredoxin
MTTQYKYRVHGVDSERGWGKDYWHVDFNTRTEAEEYMKQINGKNTAPVTPDFYSRADSIEIVEV